MYIRWLNWCLWHFTFRYHQLALQDWHTVWCRVNILANNTAYEVLLWFEWYIIESGKYIWIRDNQSFFFFNYSFPFSKISVYDVLLDGECLLWILNNFDFSTDLKHLFKCLHSSGLLQSIVREIIFWWCVLLIPSQQVRVSLFWQSVCLDFRLCVYCVSVNRTPRSFIPSRSKRADSLHQCAFELKSWK